MEQNVDTRLSQLLDQLRPLCIGESNPKIKKLKGILSNTKPNPEKLFVAEGIWFCKLLLDQKTRITDFYVCPDFVRTNELVSVIAAAAAVAENFYHVSAKTFQKISEKSPDGILAVAALPQFDATKFVPSKNSIVLVLDGVEIPGNVGTMLRLADGAAVDAVIMCNRKVRITHPKLVKGSLGAVLSVPIFEFGDALQCYEWLKKHNYTMYLADTDTDNAYYNQKFGHNTAFVLGSERYGISRDFYEFEHIKLAIPMKGKCDSLNVSTAATVLVYDAAVKNKII